MPKFTQFSIDFPKDSDQLITHNPGLSESIAIIEQDRLFNDHAFAKMTATLVPLKDTTSISAKAVRLAQSKTKHEKYQAIQEIADIYKDQSALDAKQINSLSIIVDNSEIKIDNFAKLVLDHHNLIYAHKTRTSPSMDMLVDYLQDRYMLEISTEQRNFLRTQWNQSNIAGLSTKFKSNDEVTKQSNSFIFKKNKLVETKFTTTITQKETSKSANFSVTANLEDLQGVASEQNPPLIPENWIPHNRAKISLDYQSNDGLSIEIDENTIKAMQGYFTGKSAQKYYLDKAKTAVKGVTLAMSDDPKLQNKYNKLPNNLTKKSKRSV